MVFDRYTALVVVLVLAILLSSFAPSIVQFLHKREKRNVAKRDIER